MKQPTQQHQTILSETVTMGAAGNGKFWCENLNDLHTLVEGILSTDGYRPLVKSLRIHLQVFSQYPFEIQPLFVQTAGTFTDTVDIATGVTEAIVNSAIDDVYSIQKTGTMNMALKMPGEGGGYSFCFKRTIDIPANILQLLNKEIETERLQDLYSALVGTCRSNNQAYTIEVLTEINYTTVSKKIVLR